MAFFEEVSGMTVVLWFSALPLADRRYVPRG